MRAHRASDTAMLIARALVLAARDPRLARLLEPGEAELLEPVVGHWLPQLLRHRWAVRAVLAAERIALGGIFAHYLARKRRLERELRHALQGGVRQVVTLGAGFDTLALRWCSEFPAVAFFEIDHPATQAVKAAAFAGRAGPHFLPVDLAAELPDDALRRHPAYTPEAPAVVIAEGITMYLSPDRVAVLLRSCARLARRGGRVLFTFMEPAADGSLGFRGQHPLVGAWLRWRGEPFRWGVGRHALPDFLSTTGLRVDAVLDHTDLRRDLLLQRGLADLPLARGECLCLSRPQPS
jgi:methyltransferase (TIGR00027 family)